MPHGYVKLICDDCGGKLSIVGEFPRCYVSCGSGVDVYTIAEGLANMSDGAIPVLDEGVEFKEIMPRMLRCESCGALYEKL